MRIYSHTSDPGYYRSKELSPLGLLIPSPIFIPVTMPSFRHDVGWDGSLQKG